MTENDEIDAEEDSRERLWSRPYFVEIYKFAAIERHSRAIVEVDDQASKWISI